MVQNVAANWKANVDGRTFLQAGTRDIMKLFMETPIMTT